MVEISSYQKTSIINLKSWLQQILNFDYLFYNSAILTKSNKNVLLFNISPEPVFQISAAVHTNCCQ